MTHICQSHPDLPLAAVFGVFVWFRLGTPCLREGDCQHYLVLIRTAENGFGPGQEERFCSCLVTNRKQAVIKQETPTHSSDRISSIHVGCS